MSPPSPLVEKKPSNHPKTSADLGYTPLGVPLHLPASLRVTWRQTFGLPVTWVASGSARAPAALPRTLPALLSPAHTCARIPGPTWGLCRRRRRRFQPTPSIRSTGLQMRVSEPIVPRVPSRFNLPPPRLDPSTCPSACSPSEWSWAPRAARGGAAAGLALSPPRHLLECLPPQEAQRRRRGASRWVPASRSCYFPQHQRLLPVPSFLLLVGTGGRAAAATPARSLHRLLVTTARAAPAPGRGLVF